MADEGKFQRWNVTAEDLRNMTPVKARDLIIKCFYEAQKETFARARERIGMPSSDEELFATVKNMIKLMFTEVEGDFDHPTNEILSQVVEVCARKADAWGTPPDVIEYHKKQIQLVLMRLYKSGAE